jgi:hypothetical protein
MSTKYAIPVNKNTRDLVELLYPGDQLTVDNDMAHFVFTIEHRSIKNFDFKNEDALYDAHGVGEPEIVWLLG